MREQTSAKLERPPEPPLEPATVMPVNATPASVAPVQTRSKRPHPAPATLSADAHEKLGRQLTQERKFEDAIGELNEALRLRPASAGAFNARGYVYLLLRDYKRATADFSQALRIKPDYENAQRNIAAASRAAEASKVSLK